MDESDPMHDLFIRLAKAHMNDKGVRLSSHDLRTLFATTAGEMIYDYAHEHGAFSQSQSQREGNDNADG